MANRYWSSSSLILVGQEYGKWVVVNVGSPCSLCRCGCGAERPIRNSRMVAGKVTGGCHRCANKRVRPGRRKYQSALGKVDYAYLGAKVRNAIARCTDKDHRLWPYYGGRGIKIFPKWAEDPAAFIAHLAGLPGALDRSLVLDREDNDGGYCPGNVRFVTRSQSQRNKGPYRNKGKQRGSLSKT